MNRYWPTEFAHLATQAGSDAFRRPGQSDSFFGPAKSAAVDDLVERYDAAITVRATAGDSLPERRLAGSV